MNTLQILKKSLGLVWHYRTLWLFGALLALTVNNALWFGVPRRDETGEVIKNQIILSDTFRITFSGQGVTIDFRTPGAPVVKIEGVERVWYLKMSDVWALLISIGVAVLISILLTVLFRYTSEAALIRMVDENERNAKMVSVRRGLRLGWSRVAGKLFLIDLCITLPVILAFGLLFFLALSPLFLLGLESITKSVVSIFGISLLALAGLLLFITLAVAADVILSITRPVMHQACVVDGLGVSASIRQGFRLLKTRFDRVIMTWLVWLAVRISWAIAIIPALILVSPVMLLTMGLGIVIGAVPTLLAVAVASQYVNTIFAWIIGAVFGLPLFVLVTLSPIFFLSGLVEVLKSSFWTLSYREFHSLTSAVPQPAEKQKLVTLNTALAQ